MSETFDEAELVARLEVLPPRFRTAFALLCVARIKPCYWAFEPGAASDRTAEFERLYTLLWSDLLEAGVPVEELAEADRCAELLEPGDETWAEDTQPYAEDAAAALGYAIRSRIQKSSQDAAWSAKRVYEAADYRAVAERRGSQPFFPPDVTSSIVVQRELSRQRRDLNELSVLARSDSSEAQLRAMRRRSESEGGDFLLVAER